MDLGKDPVEFVEGEIVNNDPALLGIFGGKNPHRDPQKPRETRFQIGHFGGEPS